MSWIFVKQNAGPWSPSNLSSLAAWYDADAITGINDGDRLQTWNDSSGNGRNVSNPTTNGQPYYQTNELNGKAVVQFPTGGQHLRTNPFVFDLGASTVVWVAKRVGTGTQQYLVSEGGLNGLGIYAPVFTSTDYDWRSTSRANNYAVTNFTTVAGSDVWKIGVVEDTTSAVNAASDGGAYVQVGTYTRSATTLDTFALGQLYRDIAQYGFNGYCAEILIIGGALSTADKQKVEGYLAHKWGLTANLPSGHPYKTAAPTG